MSLQFIIGNSGSGKSEFLYEHILKEAEQDPERNFLILVPEQFTMQTQRELVGRQKKHAIMNVDVLSFARLAYRVFDELGMNHIVVLEETGKNLVLRRIAEQKKKKLCVLGGNMNRMGYVGEIKSLISELTQYNVSPQELAQFLETEQLGEALKRKLSDVLALYQGFRDYLEGKYITSEEVLELLCEVADQSAMLQNCVIVFDEFTGFTPIQNSLIQKLLTLADRIVVSVTMDIREDFYHSRGIHELFAMSKKTVEVLTRMAVELPTEILEPVILRPGQDKRYRNAPALFFMEQNLFRTAGRRWNKRVENIAITLLKNPREELAYAAGQITALVREQGYRYQDIALVTGDVPMYAHYVPEIFEQYGIPYFIDQTRNILFHPFIESVRAALEVVECDFSYESIFRFLRSGLAAPVLSLVQEGGRLTEEDVDRLENYVLAKGIRGRWRWGERWTFATPMTEKISAGGAGEDDAESSDVLHMNQVRESIFRAFEPLFEAFGKNGHTVAEQTLALYRFICSLGAQEQLKEKELFYEEAGNPAKAKECAQIYKIVMDLLDKVSSLLGEERIPIREYGDILDAGFSAAKVGIIPPGVDRVTVGDIERTRLGRVKILFFVGVNDGVVPKSGNDGGILSQFEREKMAAHHLQLAPGAREKVFIQKFYLYLNLTKPSDRLYLTFSSVGSDGKARRRSYLIGTLLKLFPKLTVEELEEEADAADILTPENAVTFFLNGLRREPEEEWTALANWYLSDENYKERIRRLFDAAYFTHTDEPVARAVTRALYGNVLENSVTRLERFASCAFAHYLSYGLILQERELQQFASVDMGNIYHDALEHFSARVKDSAYTWFDLPEALEEEWVEQSMEEAILGCRNAGVFEDARNRYLLLRMKATIRKTVWALITQIRKGRFTPSGFEVSFSRLDHLDALHFTLSEDEKMRLRGRIDRVDTYEANNAVYVRIIDYKSGNNAFSLLNIYHGLQLQLVVYLNAAMELTGQNYPGKEIKPAGVFYYHIKNPMVDGTGTESDQEIGHAVLEQLKLNGLVNEEPDVYRAMDADFSGSSEVIPVSLKTDGSLKANSRTASTQQFETISGHVNRLLTKAGQGILGGDVSVRPYLLDGKSGCDYCPYHTVCGFDRRIPGYTYRKLEKLEGPEEIFAKMDEAAE